MTNTLLISAAAFVAGTIFPKLISYGVNFLLKKVDIGITGGMKRIEDIKDEKLRSCLADLVYAAVKLAEYLIPDKGTGKQKFAVVDKVLCYVPGLKTNAVLREDIINGCVSFMNGVDERFKTFIEEGVDKS